MKQKKQISNKTIVWTAVLGSLTVILMVTANTLWSSRKTNEATNEAVSAVSSFYLEAMADRRAKTITNLINSNFEQMEKAVDFIADEGIVSQDDLRHNIGMVKSLLNLNRFALIDENDIVYTQYTTYTGRSRHSFLSDVEMKDRIITTVSVYGSSKQLCLAVPTPGLTLMGKPFKACFVQLYIEDIVDLLAFDDQGRTHFALYAKNGGNLSGTDLGSIIAKHNFFDAIRSILPEEVWNYNYANFRDEKEGTITFASGESEETLCYVPIEGTGWEMAVLICESVIQDQIRDISESNLENSRNQIIFASAALLILAVILLLQLRRFSKERIEEEKETSRSFKHMANTDSLTGVRNKHAYSETEAVINSQIESGELQNLGVVVGDINGLKYVNDTFGHAQGDRLIKDACTLICEYFKQGAVFRIGGDEFAVILQGKGYESMMEIIEELNRKVEENIRENSVVVSIGYSVLGEDDHTLQDVFVRADQMMYERKNELKTMGARTGRM
ncbi:MAG: GGDEF domain-containing protein [Lachnospiraceae bacterium]|nr:GGDEF domain-containing protein [Lachnospiraceae bacterium]